jgi:hypothetical protein
MEWNWEEAGQSAWGRQLLGDDSSDEDESEIRCGRFAESGRWMSELYGYPRHLTPTSGGECKPCVCSRTMRLSTFCGLRRDQEQY